MKIYLVGGAVRDTVLGMEPKDRDYVIVGATQSDVDRLMEEGYKQVGKDFPVFLHPETQDEYAFARVERKVAPGHQGFTTATEGVTLEEDLGRRDLTINAMAMDLETGAIIDPYGGQLDLRAGLIRHTTHAFAEDPLRVFRAAKFVARYGFSVHPHTLALMRTIVTSGEMDHLARERIVAEMIGVMSGTHPDRGLRMLHDVDALSYFSGRVAYIYPLMQKCFDNAALAKSVPANLRLGFLMGVAARIAPDWKPTDDQFRKELINMKLSADTMQCAMTFKTYGYVSNFEQMTADAVIPMLKRLGFTSDDSAAFNHHYYKFCVEARGDQNSNEFYTHCVWRRCADYVKKLKTIDREAISMQHGSNGKAIAAAIRVAEIEVINFIDRFDKEKPEGHNAFDVVTNRPAA